MDALAEEHRIFETLIERLERGLKYPAELARAEWKKIFLVLLPALQRHEEIESLVFEDPAYLAKKGARKFLAEAHWQHGELSALRRDILEALEETSLPELPRLGLLVAQLARRLRDHFGSEETRLWPHYRGAMRHASHRGLERKAREKLRQFRREVAAADLAVADYLS